MKIIIEQPALAKALKFAIEATPKKDVIPVLNCALIETVGDTALRITCTDLDVTVKSEVDANIETQGVICVHVRKLSEVVNRLPNAPISIVREDNGWAKITCLKSSYRIPGVERETFPQIPPPPRITASLASDDIAFLLNNTKGSVTTELSRYTLNGIQFEFENGVRAIATDNNQLAIASIETPAELESFLLPRGAVSAILQLADGSESLACGTDENHIYFKGESGSIIARKLTGKFPNYQMIIPKNNDKVMTVNAGELLTITERLASVADAADSLHSKKRRIYLLIRQNELQLTAQSAEVGDGEEVISASYTEEELKLPIWSRDLITGLKPYAADEQVKLTFKDARSQMTVEAVEPKNGRTNLHIIMPLQR